MARPPLFPHRMVIYPQDVIQLTGKSLSNARWMLRELRKQMGLVNRKWVLFWEFCNFYKFKEERVLAIIQKAGIVLLMALNFFYLAPKHSAAPRA